MQAEAEKNSETEKLELIEFIKSIETCDEFKSFVKKMNWQGKTGSGKFKLGDIKSKNLEECKEKAVLFLSTEEEEISIPEVVTIEFIESITHFKILGNLIRHMNWGGPKGYFKLRDIKACNFIEQKNKCIEILRKEIKSSKCDNVLDKVLITGEKIINEGNIYVKDKRGILISKENSIIYIPIINKKHEILKYCIASIDSYEEIIDRNFSEVNNRGNLHIVSSFNEHLTRLIVKNVPEKCKIGHLNGNKDDFRKENLIAMNQSQISQLRKKTEGKHSSNYRGVGVTNEGNYKTSLVFKGQRIHIGTFLIEEEAAKAYDYHAFHYFRERCGNNGLLTDDEIQDVLKNGIPNEYLYKGGKEIDSDDEEMEEDEE